MTVPIQRESVLAEEVELGKPVRVAPGVWRLPLPMRADPGHINSWLLEDGDGWLVVDTGIRKDTTRDIWRAFMASDLYGAGITRIFQTHAHPDHAGSTPWLARETGAPVLMAVEEQRALENFAVPGEQRDREIEQWLGARGASDQQIKMTQLFYHHFAEGCPQIETTVETVAPGETLKIGGRSWQLHGGYGHTPCNLLMYQPDARYMITGDQILPDIVTHVGLWWRQSESPLESYLESLDRLGKLPVEWAFPAHGDPFDNFNSRCAKLRRIHNQRLEKLEKALADGPLSTDRLLRKFGGPAVEGAAFPLIAGQIQARLAWLLEKGRVRFSADEQSFRVAAG